MRKSPAKKRRLLPDAKYNSTMVTQFVNNMMLDGKKSTAFRIFYDAMDVVEQKVEEESALNVWKKAVENVTPAVEVRVDASEGQPSKFRNKFVMLVNYPWQ